MIKITEEAKEKLTGYLNDNPGKVLRIIVKGIG